MKYETAAQMAERLGVTVRIVQLWAGSGKLPGAIKHGRDWLIPAGLEKPGKAAAPETELKNIPLPLVNSSFNIGTAADFVTLFDCEDTARLARTEYLYFTGNFQEAVELSEAFYNNENIVIKLTACLVYAFSNIAVGNTHLAELSLGCIEESVKKELSKESTDALRAYCILIASTAAILMHEECDLELEEHVRYLPEGLKLWALYVISHKLYVAGNNAKALGVVQTALLLSDKAYPLAEIYLHLSAAMNYMALKDIESGRRHFLKAWETALPDGFFEPFGEHHGLLCGLIEACLKSEYYAEYKEIIGIANKFSKGWRTIHNDRMKKTVTHNLATTEFVISMLASRGWSNQEIADYMNMSLHNVKRYISIVYQKLDITSRGQLKQYMLK